MSEEVALAGQAVGLAQALATGTATGLTGQVELECCRWTLCQTGLLRGVEGVTVSAGKALGC